MKVAAVKEDSGVPSATDMIRCLVEDHQTVVKAARSVVGITGELGDHASNDLGVRRIDVHEKAAWMLRSHLE